MPDFKEGVALKRPTIEVIYGMAIADRVAIRLFGKPATVTAINDGRHSTGSLHYNDPDYPADQDPEAYAFDVRTVHSSWGLQPKQIKQYSRELQRSLGPHWDVVIERTHIHCEFDPEF